MFFIKYFLSICFCVLIYLNLSTTQEVCRHPRSVKRFDEVPCTEKIWYIYAGSKPCEGCCITRSMILLEPGKIQAIDTTTINGQTTSVTFIVQRNSTDATYYLSGNPLPIRIIDTDCETYGVVYSEPSDQIQVFSYEPIQDPDFLRKNKGVKWCHADLYEYNPAVNCFV